MSERTDNPLPSGQIFFENRWTRAAAAVFGIPAVIAPIACAPQAAIVQPASASELGAETIEFTATPEPTLTPTRTPFPIRTIVAPVARPAFENAEYLPGGWIKQDHFYLLPSDNNPSIHSLITVASRASSAIAEKEWTESAFSDVVDNIRVGVSSDQRRVNLDYDVLMGETNSVRIKIRIIERNDGVKIWTATIPTSLISAHEQKVLTLLDRLILP